MKNLPLRCALFIAALMISGLLCAQGLFTKTLGIQDGLLKFDNYRITEDHSGGIWLCSPDGVVRFFRGSYQQYTTLNGLGTNDVWDIAIDSKNRVWLSSFSPGIEYILDGKVSVIPEAEKFDQIYFAGEHEDTVFFQVMDNDADERYYLTNDGKFEKYTRFNQLGFTVKADFRELGYYLLTKINGDRRHDWVYFEKTEKWQELEFRLLPLTGRVIQDFRRVYLQRVGYDRGFVYHLMSQAGPIRLTHTEFMKADQEEVSESDRFILVSDGTTELILDKERKGERRKDLENILRMQVPNRNPGGFVHKDHQRNIWFTEYRGGVHFIHRDAIIATEVDAQKVVTRHPEILEPVKLKFKNFLIFRTHDHRLLSLNTGTGVIETLFDSKIPIRSLEVRGEQLFILNTGRMVVIPLHKHANKVELNFEAARFYNFKEPAMWFDFLDDNTLVLANGLLLHLDRPASEAFEKMEGIKLPFRTAQIVAADSIIVYSSTVEVGWYNIRSHETEKLDIRSPNLIKRYGSKIFVGSSSDGLYSIDISAPKKIRHIFNEQVGINDIIKYHDSYILCTNLGLFRGEMQRNHHLKITRSFLTDRSLGIMVNSALVDDKLYVMTNKGAVTLNLRDLDSREVAKIQFNLQINDIHGRPLLNDDVLHYKNNYISVDLHDGSYFDYTFAVFRYKLIGYDSTWNYSTNRTVSYKELKSGDYTFVVESSDSQFGVFGSRKSVRFSVDQPFFQKWWFIGLLFIVLCAMVLLFYFFIRTFTHKRQQRRARIRELEHQALRAQLNPHFVYNCMNSIQSLIILEDEQVVNDYICSFSDLMRKVLDSSKQNRISLDDEVTLLSSYLNLECNRLNKSLEYEIVVQEGIDQKSTYLYGMVFQPIVENAIIHAFLTNQKDKRITISFELNEDQLIGTVTDNGIGRKRSMELKRRGEFKSWASTILNEKSRLLNNMRRNELSITTIDLYDGEDAIGTKVEVRMRITFAADDESRW